MIDLVKDQLPELQLSEEDRQKNLELLEQAKKVSDRFLTRRGRRSTGSLTDSPTGRVGWLIDWYELIGKKSYIVLVSEHALVNS